MKAHSVQTQITSVSVNAAFSGQQSDNPEKEAMRACQLRGIKTVECAISDVSSVARGKVLTVPEFDAQRGTRLPAIIFGTTVTGGEPRAIYEDLIPSSYPDVALVPDWATFVADPLIADRATVICDVVGTFTTPQEITVDAASLTPRGILKRVLQRLQQHGFSARVAPELEFFLVALPAAHNGNALVAASSPFHADVRETFIDIFSLERTSSFAPFFSTLFDACEAQNIPVTGFSHEAAASQYEVNFAPAEPLAQADAVFRFKRLAREVALRFGCAATFLAKPFAEGPGSGMHWHLSLLEQDSGRNVFSENGAEESAVLQSFIAGLQEHALGCSALIAPYENSYLRFQKHEAAPAAASWGRDDRSVAFRIPVSNQANRRIENRLPGADANPYLVLATMIGAGLDGIERTLKPRAAVSQDDAGARNPSTAMTAVELLPLSLDAALHALCRDTYLVKMLGQQFVASYAALKRHELAERHAAPCGLTWDIAHLLHHA